MTFLPWDKGTPRPMPRPAGIGATPAPSDLSGLGKLGMMLMATGTSLKGGNGMQFYQQYEADQEKAKRKANIQGLLDSMNLSQQKRAFLEMLPFEQATPIIWDLMNPKPVAGRAPTEAERAARFAATLGGMPATPAGTGGGFSMGVPDELVAPVAAAGGLSLGAPAVTNPAPSTTPGLSFGNIQPSQPKPPVNPYVALRERTLAELSDPQVLNRVAMGDPDAIAYVNQRNAILKEMEMYAPPAAPEPADEYQRYVQEEIAAGREPLTRIDFAQAKKGNGFSVQLADGTTVQYGGASDGFGDVERIDPTSTGAMVDSITNILNDPALENATGMLEWTQAIPGTPMYRFGTRVKQLQGQAFLQAFEALKGGGQITEVEGQKATEAIGRLDSGQSAEDYRDALSDLKEILIDAMERPRGWANTTAGKIATMSARDIGKLDLKNLTEEELNIARRRLMELREK